MGDLGLSIAATGLDAQQVAMDTVAQNLANANTPGYVRETANLSATGTMNMYGVGGGVQVTGVTQAPDGLLAASAQQANGALAQSTALQQVLSQAQTAFPEPSSTGFGAQLSAFWQSWDAVAQNPSALAPRTEVVTAAQNLAVSLQQASSQITQLQGNTQSQLSSVITQDNGLLQQVAHLNAQIVAVQSTGASANSLIDQRNQVENQLASDLGAVARPASDGSVTISVGGVSLVQGSLADSLTLSGSPGSWQVMTQTSKVALPASSGTAAGLLAAANQYLPSYQSQLDAVANALATTVNSQLAAGYTATGASGAGYPLFQGSTAAGLTVNPAVVANPQLLAASSTGTTPDAANNGSNAQAMAELFNTGGGPDESYRTLVQNIGSQVQSANNQVQAQQAVANAAQANLQAVDGVNTDQQMVLMLGYQQAYQASAKVISTVNTMMQALLASV